jgi:hypothetical protein
MTNQTSEKGLFGLEALCDQTQNERCQKLDEAQVADLILDMTPEQIASLLGENKGIRGVLENILSHSIPDSKSIANKHIKDKLDAHTKIARALSLVSAACSASAFATITSLITPRNPAFSKLSGAVMGLATYAIMQKALKEDALDRTEYAEDRLKSDLKKRNFKKSLRVDQVGEVLSRKRLLASVGVSGLVALSATAMALIELPEQNKDAIFKFNERQIASRVHAESQNDEKARASIIQIQKELQTQTNSSQVAILNEQLAKVKSSDPVFSYYGEQLVLEQEQARCTQVLGQSNIGPAIRNTSNYQSCVTFNGGAWNGANIPRGKPEFDTKIESLIANIQGAGGEYKAGEPPLTASLNNQKAFESAKSVSPDETIINYWEKVGKNSAEKDKGRVLVERIKSGEWLEHDVHFGKRLEIGIDRMFDELGNFHLPPEIAAAIIILIVESISIINTGSVLTDDEFTKIYFNSKLQTWGHKYNSDLSSKVKSRLSGQKQITTLEIKQIVLELAHRGMLEGQQELVTKYVNTEFGEASRTMQGLAQQNDKLVAGAILTDNSHTAQRIEAGSQKISGEINNHILANKRELRHQSNIAQLGWLKGRLLNRAQDIELYEQEMQESKNQK